MRTKTIYPILWAAVSILMLTLMVIPVVAQISISGDDTSLSVTANVTPAPTTPIPTTAPTTQDLTSYSWLSFWIVFFLIALLGFLFYLLIMWSNRLEQTSYLGTVYRDTIFDIELKRLKTDVEERYTSNKIQSEVEVDDKWLTEEPAPKYPLLEPEIELKRREFPYKPPESYNPNPYAQTSVEIDYASGYSFDFETKFTDFLKANKTLLDKYLKYKQDLIDWETKLKKEVNARYHKELSDAVDKARTRADSAASIEFGIFRGKGTEFVLEFTTVVVIIFAAIILGVLKVLDTQQIGTLLAAIAGYVLGRATSRSKEGVTTSTPPTATDVVSVINAVRGLEPTPQPATITKYTITANAEAGGSISPSGDVPVAAGANQTFSITASSGYMLADIIVDGQTMGADTPSYTFEKVQKDHQILAKFLQKAK